jgi:two-component system C4-dicarboxylate transport response regulator DctD
LNRSRILVVDDDEPVLKACVRALGEISGVEIVQKKASDQAARLLSSESFDLLISDIRMPGLSGLDLLEIAHDHDPDLPVILITGFGPPETQKGSVALGVSACLMKPIRPDELINITKEALQSRRKATP